MKLYQSKTHHILLVTISLHQALALVPIRNCPSLWRGNPHEKCLNIPIPPSPFDYSAPNNRISLTLTNYGSRIPLYQGRALMAAWLHAWNDITHDGSPEYENVRLGDRIRVWSAGPVRFTLIPRTEHMVWGDVYLLIVLMMRFLRTYAGFVEGDMEIRGGEGEAVLAEGGLDVMG